MATPRRRPTRRHRLPSRRRGWALPLAVLSLLSLLVALVTSTGAGPAAPVAEAAPAPAQLATPAALTDEVAGSRRVQARWSSSDPTHRAWRRIVERRAAAARAAALARARARAAAAASLTAPPTPTTPGPATASSPAPASSSTTTPSAPGPATSSSPSGSSSSSGCTTSGAVGAVRTTAFPPTGAVPDDGRDDRAAVQAALDAAGRAGGGVVALSAGTYLVDGALQVRDGVALRGTGAATVVKAGPSFLSSRGPRGGHPLITTVGADRVTVADLTADQSGDVLDGNVAGRLSEYLVDVRESTDALVSGVHTRNPFTYSIAAAGSTRFCITGSSTSSATVGRYDQLDGIHVLNSSYGDVVGNTVDQGQGGAGGDGDDGLVAHTIGGSVHHVRYAGNTVRSGRHGSGMQLAFSQSSDVISDVVVEGNTFWGSPRGIKTGTYGSPGSAARITVRDNTFTDNGGDAVSLGGALQSVSVTGNTACRSGGFVVAGARPAGNSTTC